MKDNEMHQNSITHNFKDFAENKSVARRIKNRQKTILMKRSNTQEWKPVTKNEGTDNEKKKRGKGTL